MWIPFGMDILLYICCMFSKHLFLRTSLKDCFCSFQNKFFGLVMKLVMRLVMKCKNVMFFFNSPALFSKCTFFRLWNFFSPTANSIFALVICVYKIHVFDKVFFAPSNLHYHNWKSIFPVSMVTTARKTIIFIKITRRINPNYNWKIESNR